MNKVMNIFSTMRIACACALLLFCACDNTNNPTNGGETQENGICAPVTDAQRIAIQKSFADNYDCLVSWLGGEKGDVLELRTIASAQQSDAIEVSDDLDGCFPDVYAHFETEMIDGKFVDKSYLKQRVYIVYAISKWKYISDAELRDLEASGRGNEQLYFDANFDLIPRDKCECDCWISNK